MIKVLLLGLAVMLLVSGADLVALKLSAVTNKALVKIVQTTITVSAVYIY